MQGPQGIRLDHQDRREHERPDDVRLPLLGHRRDDLSLNDRDDAEGEQEADRDRPPAAHEPAREGSGREQQRQQTEPGHAVVALESRSDAQGREDQQPEDRSEEEPTARRLAQRGRCRRGLERGIDHRQGASLLSVEPRE